MESAEEREARLARRRVLKGQSSASCTVYCSLASQTYFRERMRANAFTEIRLARETKSSEREEALQRRREREFRAEFTYVLVRLYGRICAAMSNILRLAPQCLHFSSIHSSPSSNARIYLVFVD